ncbi:DUF3072 domain-containing protein [Streptomyces ficellus]|uniref:DUF3072 domain-containing protein n=1 Tax=Streptomyces ficellus TaxID=1977088 RepID=A0ABT7Z160_9ACTN|nr:DUF3072 domain-containing protein [Streptomyces ficellus]MDN3293206.1 DUF3072 domain-containing protein [Streptomyces ficellus]
MSEENPSKDVEDWVTGDEPATGPQLSYLHTLAREAGEEVPPDLTKAEASRMIDRLQQASPRTGRPGASGGGPAGGEGG